MSNPFLDLQNDSATRLAARASLADIPMITEELGDVVNRLERGLVKGGVKQNTDGKAGCAMIIHTPTGNGDESLFTLTKTKITVRVEIYFKLTINDSPNGLQKIPLDVLWDVISQMLSWRPGPGDEAIQLGNYGVLENRGGELNYFADFVVPKVLTIE